MSIYVAVALNLLAAVGILVLAVAALEHRPKPETLTDYAFVEQLPNYAELAA